VKNSTREREREGCARRVKLMNAAKAAEVAGVDVGKIVFAPHMDVYGPEEDWWWLKQIILDG
jgi:hypothetical protein